MLRRGAPISGKPTEAKGLAPAWQPLTLLRLCPSESGGGGGAMDKSQQGARLEPHSRDLRAHNSKLPEIPCFQECRPVVAQPPKEQKLPILTSGHKFLGNKVSAKSFRSNIFENSWKTAVIKTKMMKQEYISTCSLNDSSENPTTPSVGQEECSATPTPSPFIQKIQGSANSFPDSSSTNNTNCFPSLYLHSCTSSSQCSTESVHKNRGDAAMGDISKRVVYSWKPGILKKPEIHTGAGELGALRLKKYNHSSSLISFSQGSKFKPGYRFRDPVNGAPPQYLQRLSELAALQCATVHRERNRKTRKTKQPVKEQAPLQ